MTALTELTDHLPAKYHAEVVAAAIRSSWSNLRDNLELHRDKSNPCSDVGTMAIHSAIQLARECLDTDLLSGSNALPMATRLSTMDVDSEAVKASLGEGAVFI